MLEYRVSFFLRKFRIMYISLGGYRFDDPVISTDQLDERSGVYVVLDAFDHSKVLDVGYSENVRERLETHDRRDQWELHAEWFAYAAYWCSPRRMEEIEDKLRLELAPLSGKR